MQGIYTYIPETNYVSREYSVAAILLLLFMVLISLVSVLNLLYFYIITFQSMCAVPNMADFWSSFTSYSPGMLLTYFLNDFEIVPVTPIITGITSTWVCTSASCNNSNYILLYFKNLISWMPKFPHKNDWTSSSVRYKLFLFYYCSFCACKMNTKN